MGKKLFYDGRLSKDGLTSCASCHQHFAAFSTFEHDLSHGVNNSFTTRNAPALFNLAWKKNLNWDGGVNHIEVQPLGPLTAPNEMGETLDSVLKKIQSDAGYRQMFKAAFGSGTVTSQRMLKALAQFTGSIISCNSKYDRVKNGKASFNAYEQKGYEIYKIHCASCHPEPLFTDNSYRNNGSLLNRFADIGRMKITGNKTDSLRFMVPSLRNVQVSLPYMHDGSIAYITKTINHYTKIDTSLPQLDPILKKRIVLTDRNKTELLSFLFALTDTGFTKNKRYAPDERIEFRH